MSREHPFAIARGLRLCLMLGCVVAALLGCDKRHIATNAPGWYLEKTGDTTADLIVVSKGGERDVWSGSLVDDTPPAPVSKPLVPEESVSVLRWSRPGCTALSFRMTRYELKCATCLQPVKLVPDSGTCPIDQQRLPVEGWTGVGLPLPK